jgi:NADH-quinone oxidoreductase subunit G
MANPQDIVTVNIDGRDVQVPKGVMLVEAAKAIDVEIPVFCYHPKIDPVGMCRMCLVEIGNPARAKDGTPELDAEGKPVINWMPKLVTACTTPVADGMHTRVATTRVADAWRGTLEFLLTSHPLDCPVCDKGGECPLQDLTVAYGPDLSRFYKRSKFHFEKPIPLGDLIWLDQERCIYCARCIRFQEEIAGDPVLRFADRNRAQQIVTYSDPPFNSYFSGNTTDICPVGALTTEDFRLKARPWELNNVPSVCNHCAVGCNTVLGTRTNAILRVMPRQNEQVNELWLCDKGRFGHHFVRSEDRLTTPLIRDEGGQLREATWAEALSRVASRLAAIMAEHGSAAIGGIAGDRASNEDLYLFGRFMRDVIGTNNIDHRLHWPAGTGIEEAVLNVGLTSGSNLGELVKGSVILAFGSDLEEEQPVTYLRVRRATQQGARLVLVQNRTTKELRDASEHLPVSPGSEAHLALALLKRVAGAENVNFGKLGGVDELQAGLHGLDENQLLETAGIEVAMLDALAEAVSGAGSLVVMVGRQAVEDAGANARALVAALAALLVATGKAGELNSGLIPLWPHNNTQGAIDMGILPWFAAGYQTTEHGANMEQMLSGDARLRAAYVMAADPARERPSSVEILRGLDFLVVQELFMTETAMLADVVLPAAAYAERDGTFVNIERRVQRFQKGLNAPGQALADWRIIADLAAQFDAGWPDFFVAADVGAEIASKVKLYKGFSYDRLRGEPVGWTTTAAGHHIFTGTSVLNTWLGRQWEVAAEGRRPKFDLRWHDLVDSEPAAEGQFRLLTQRKLYDNGTMIRRSTLLDGRRALPFVKLSARDADSLGLANGDMVTVSAATGEVTAPLVIDVALEPGLVVVPLNVDEGSLNALAESSGEGVAVARAVAEFA